MRGSFTSLLPPQLPLVLWLLVGHGEVGGEDILLLIGGELGRLPAVVDGEDVPLLVGSELGRLPAVVVDGDDVLLLVGGELGHLPTVVDGEDVLLLIGSELGRLPAVADGETSRETSRLDSGWG